MQWFKKKYRDLQGHQSSRVILDILVNKIAHLTGTENSEIIDALWDTNPAVKLEADDEGNRTNQVILPPSKRALHLFEYLYDLDKYPSRERQSYEAQSSNITAFDRFSKSMCKRPLHSRDLLKDSIRLKVEYLMTKFKYDDEIWNALPDNFKEIISIASVRNLRHEIIKERKALKQGKCE